MLSRTRNVIYFVDYYLSLRVRISYVNIFFPRRAVDFVKGFYEIFIYFHGSLVLQVENSADIDYRILRDNVGPWESIRRGSGRDLYLRSKWRRCKAPLRAFT